MLRVRIAAASAALAVVLAACGVEVSVTSERADRIAGDEPPAVVPTEPGTDDPANPTTSTPAPPDDPDGPPPAPSTTTAPPPPQTTVPLLFDETAIDFGPDKPDRPYDTLLLATATDLRQWWSEQYPLVYGESFEPLAGRIYAAYPGRPDDLPGCGEPRTTYDDVQLYVAFYCGVGDFIVYDDGENGLLYDLADEFGPATIAVVLAHEYGHAIQLRTGALTRALPTVLTEQQADCFAGAWTGRVARSEAPGISFTDDDVRAGLIAMLEVSDPVGVGQLTPGGHGSGFDRVGAFQEGFEEGPARCAELLDDPLPLMPNEFQTVQDFQNQGDAPFGFGEEDLFGFIVEDLNLYWGTDRRGLAPAFEELTLVSVPALDAVECPGQRTVGDGVFRLCAGSDEVLMDEAAARELYGQLGDFALGYLVGVVWAEAAQLALGSTLTGEERALTNDCLAGAWVQTVIPEVDGALPEPRAEGRTSVVSPGDLDEAIQTAIAIGDDRATDDGIGSPLEKIDAFRDGVLGGAGACGL